MEEIYSVSEDIVEHILKERDRTGSECKWVLGVADTKTDYLLRAYLILRDLRLLQYL